MAKRQKSLGLSGKGVEQRSIPELLVAGEAYEKARDARMKKTEAEKIAKAALIEVMIKNGETVYRDDDASPPILITVSTKHGVKVERITEEEPEDDAGEEGAGDAH